MRFLGWLLGIEEVTSIDEIDPSLAAPWASDDFGPFWVFLGCAALVALALAFYGRYQPKGTMRSRLSLGACRGLLLALLFVTLAHPVLRITVTSFEHPWLYVVFDGTDSMAIEDDLPPDDRTALQKAVELPATRDGATNEDANDAKPSRMAYVQAWLNGPSKKLFERLHDEKHVRIQPFIFDGQSTSQLRKLEAHGVDGRGAPDTARWAEQLSTKGQVTALGAALDDAGQQFGAGHLAAVVMVSDFANNSGPPPLGASAQAPATRLGAPLYTVGIGATEALDIAVDLQTDPKMKKAERSTVTVKLRQSGFTGRTVTATVTAKKLGGDADGKQEEEITVGQKTVTLTSAVESVDLPFTPQEAGRFEFHARVEPLDGETVVENNRARREVNIIDDYLRLMFVAHEPTWEWRFIKEVFHRDKLVGQQGFRTFLASSDPRVRESNVLFLPTLTPKRSEFFANDVIFLDDMPRGGLSARFGELVKEYVGTHGGGLVVIAGPRFGVRELADSPLADLLPVTVDPNAKLRDERDFVPRLTPFASREAFMKLGESDVENARAWLNLGSLPWYQPVLRVRPEATVLMEHPTDTCADGKPQPLIATRPYGAGGKGQVVYIGFNETWRLRRRYGEKYYRQFWSQLIYQLGMSHALGDSKRFVPRLDRQQYRAEERVTFTVEAYDENYEPLGDDKLPGGVLTAELISPSGDGPQRSREITVPRQRDGVFETRFPVYAPGEYLVRIKDPVSGRFEERRFEVTDVSAERRRAVRDVNTQEQLAVRTGGRTYDLTNVEKLADDLDVQARRETTTRNHSLASTPLWFILVIALMVGEWFSRKMMNLP